MFFARNHLKPQLLKLLSNLPNTQKVQQRKAFLMFIGFDRLASQIELEGDNFSFFAGLIEVLTSEGQTSLLEFLDNLVESPWSGSESGEQLKSLRSGIAELGTTKWRKEFFGEVDDGHSHQNPQQNIPRSGAVKFVGRSQELKKLHNHLQHNQTVIISGMAGVGKTELVIQYAYQYWEKYYPGGVCWLRPRVSNIGTQIIELFQVNLELFVPESLGGKLLNLEEQVRWCWKNWIPKELPTLVVIDDAIDYEKIEPYLPFCHSRFKILITTRIQWLVQSFVREPLEILHESAALDLLKTFLGTERIDKEFIKAKEICSWLGYLPLALELAGRYIQRKLDLSLKDFKEKLEKERLEQPSLREPKSKAGMTAKHDIKEAFNLTWGELDILAQKICSLLGLFALAPIPWYLVELCFPDQDSKDLEEIRDDSLLNLNLLRYTGNTTYQLHPLVQEFLREQLQQSDWGKILKQRFCQVMANIAQEIPQSLTQYLISKVATAIPHIVEVATIDKDFLSDEDFCFPFVGLGRFYAGQGIYDEAEFWYQQYLSVSQDRFGDEHLEVASSLNNLANLYRVRGRYWKARPLFQKALDLSKNLLGEKHPEIATILENLALLYCERGHPYNAEPLYQEALKIREQFFKEHPLALANTLNNLSGLDCSLNNYEQAEIHLERTLKIREDYLGINHPDVATTLNNLGYVYENQKRYEEAEQKYQEALELRKRLLGEEHPDVAQSLHNIGVLCAKQKQYRKAKILLEQALSMFEKFLGTRHRCTVNTRTSLRNLYDDM
ncbi:MAG: tetratricopeptide repeat protein [Cyanobacteria bacterium P01_F01_bin.143]